MGHFTRESVSDRQRIALCACIQFNFDLLLSFFSIDQNTIDEWSIIFIIGGVFYILPAALFILFGSGNVQKWNGISTKDEPAADDVVQPTTAK